MGIRKDCDQNLHKVLENRLQKEFFVINYYGRSFMRLFLS